VPLIVGGVVWLLPPPEGLSVAAWRYAALFSGVIAALVTEPLPGPAIGVIGVSVAASLRLVGGTPTESMRWALSGFSNDVVWLVFSATTFALGYEKTGLGRRIALVLVNALGRRTIGLGYAIALSDLVLAPFTPSNTARSAGTIFPVVRGIPLLYGTSPADRPRAIGGYLCWTAFAATTVTSSMFVTSMAPNLLATEMARTIAGVDITWTRWMTGFLPVGLLLIVTTPLVTYLIYPPSIAHGGEVVAWAADELREMGPVSRREWIMSGLAVLALAAWIAGSALIAAVTVALAVISLMLITGIVTWDDLAANRQGWSVLVWFATLLALADGLRQVGFLSWLAKASADSFVGLSPELTGLALVIVFFLMHYLFASTTAHTTAVLPVFLAVVVGLPGVPTEPVVMMFVYSLGIMGVLTPYGTGPAPVWYSAGYITGRDFWRLGFITGLLSLAALVAAWLPRLVRLVE
jgi:L-tartrate/succinate antiporter